MGADPEERRCKKRPQVSPSRRGSGGGGNNSGNGGNGGGSCSSAACLSSRFVKGRYSSKHFTLSLDV